MSLKTASITLRKSIIVVFFSSSNKEILSNSGLTEATAVLTRTTLDQLGTRTTLVMPVDADWYKHLCLHQSTTSLKFGQVDSLSYYCDLTNLMGLELLSKVI